MKRARHIQNYSSFYLGGIGDVPVVATLDRVNQNANISASTLYVVPAGQGGTYRATGYVVLTQPAGTSSTLAPVGIRWTDNETGVVTPFFNLGNTISSNVLGATTCGGGNPAALWGFQVQAGSTIQFSVGSYASSGSPAMQYSVHIKLEYLGA